MEEGKINIKDRIDKRKSIKKGPRKKAHKKYMTQIRIKLYKKYEQNDQQKNWHKNKTDKKGQER